MENVELKVLSEAIKHDTQIRRLYEEHVRLEDKLDSLTGRPYLTLEEEVEVRKLKKLKLLGKDRLMRLLNEFRPPLILTTGRTLLTQSA